MMMIGYGKVRVCKPIRGSVQFKHKPHTHTPCEKLPFSKWEYIHYFNLLEVKGKNVHVKCTLCPRVKCLSTSGVSNSNLMKHLSTTHASIKLVAKNCVVDNYDNDDDSRPGANVSSSNKEGHRAVQAATAGCFCSSFTKTCDTD